MEHSGDPETETAEGQQGEKHFTAKQTWSLTRALSPLSISWTWDELFDFLTWTTRRRAPAPLPSPAPFHPSPTPAPAPRLAGSTRAVADWRSPAGSAGFKEGGGGAPPSGAAVLAASRSRRRSCARRLSAPAALLASRVRPSRVGGSRARAKARGRSAAGAVQPRRTHSW